MPGILGTGRLAATAMETARNGVRASYLARNRVLTAAEVTQMRIDMEAAAMDALFIHLATNALVIGSAAGVANGTSTAPVTATVK